MNGTHLEKRKASKEKRRCKLSRELPSDAATKEKKEQGQKTESERTKEENVKKLQRRRETVFLGFRKSKASKEKRGN